MIQLWNEALETKQDLIGPFVLALSMAWFNTMLHFLTEQVN